MGLISELIRPWECYNPNSFPLVLHTTHPRAFMHAPWTWTITLKPKTHTMLTHASYRWTMEDGSEVAPGVRVILNAGRTIGHGITELGQVDKRGNAR